MVMSKNIEINEKNKTIHIPNNIYIKILKLIEDNIILKEAISSCKENWIDFNSFKEIISEITYTCSRIANAYDDYVYPINIDKELERELESLCEEYLEINPDDEILYTGKVFAFEKDLKKTEKVIDIAYRIYELNKRIYLMSDLARAKEDCIKDMQYFMPTSEIIKFEKQYSEAIENKDIDKMTELLKHIQEEILKEWNQYISNVFLMTDDNFHFIGHSTNCTKYEGEFHTRYVSCSLYNQDVNDTYHSNFGFIMSPQKIVGASSSDMYIDNEATDKEGLLHYSSILQINHPKRIIDECIRKIQKLKSENSDNIIFSEVVIDGFEPIGIFCFTNGAKNLDPNYKAALELQKSFPNLRLKTFDLLNIKKGKDLEREKLTLINLLRKKYGSNVIETYDLQRYNLFFNQFANLKKNGNYDEEDIEKIYKYNAMLLSDFEKKPEELFDGRYTDIEIKYILGKNPLYNIDYILANNYRMDDLSNLGCLYSHRHILNKYYDGLSEFVEVLRKTGINQDDLEELKKELNLNFYKIDKCLLKLRHSELSKNEDNVYKKPASLT